MAKKNNYEVIDQMFAAMLSQNESEATIKALRPQYRARHAQGLHGHHRVPRFQDYRPQTEELHMGEEHAYQRSGD